MSSAGSHNSFHEGMKFRLLAERLRQQISDGDWPVGGRLPTEPQLAAAHAVGVNTVRRAVGVLVAEGIVERRQGSGTYVAQRPVMASTGRRLVGVERALTAAETGFILASSEYRYDLERMQLRSLLDSGVEGLIVVPNLHVMDDPQAHVDSLRELPVPYVLVERRPPRPTPDDPTCYVVTNHAGGVFTAVRHLVGLGHTRIGYLGRVRTGTSEEITDTEGFERSMRTFGMDPVAQAVVRRVLWTTDEIGEFALACRDHRVGAVFCHGDRDAATLLAHARRLGLRVPEDLAIVAYDDEVAELGDPPLTAVAPPKAELGALAAELLLRRITAGTAQSPHRIELQPRLIVRASCGGEPTALLPQPVLPALS
jgi:GntR family transcriptional regulator of arabinose operon